MAGHRPWRELHEKLLAKMTPKQRAAYEREVRRMIRKVRAKTAKTNPNQ